MTSIGGGASKKKDFGLIGQNVQKAVVAGLRSDMPQIYPSFVKMTKTRKNVEKKKKKRVI